MAGVTAGEATAKRTIERLRAKLTEARSADTRSSFGLSTSGILTGRTTYTYDTSAYLSMVYSRREYYLVITSRREVSTQSLPVGGRVVIAADTIQRPRVEFVVDTYRIECYVPATAIGASGVARDALRHHATLASNFMPTAEVYKSVVSGLSVGAGGHVGCSEAADALVTAASLLLGET